MKSRNFEKMLDSLLEELDSDEVTKDFGAYFRTHYTGRTEEWAYCYRRGSGINTNMYLESLHKTLKYYYLHGRKNKRMDRCINALLKFIRDKTFTQFIKMVKNIYSAKEDSIARSHAEAVKNIDSAVIKQ